MKVRLLLTGTVLALLLTGCGDDGDDPVADTATEAGGRAGEAAGEAGEAATEAGDAAGQAATEAGEAAGEAASEAGEAATEAVGEAGDVVSELRSRGLDMVATALEAVGVENLFDDTTFTLLAPNDDALAALGADGLAELATDPNRAAEILRDHIVDETLSSDELAEMAEVEASSGNAVPISSDGGQLTVGGASVTEADIEVGDGVIHVVDAVVEAQGGGAEASGS